MGGLDSIYAMLARPVKYLERKKRIVKQLDETASISPDSHETPQSQLPPKYERRQTTVDRRRTPRVGTTEDRRGAERRKQDALKAEQEATKDPLPHVNIDV